MLVHQNMCFINHLVQIIRRIKNLSFSQYYSKRKRIRIIFVVSFHSFFFNLHIYIYLHIYPFFFLSTFFYTSVFVYIRIAFFFSFSFFFSWCCNVSVLYSIDQMKRKIFIKKIVLFFFVYFLLSNCIF